MVLRSELLCSIAGIVPKHDATQMMSKDILAFCGDGFGVLIGDECAGGGVIQVGSRCDTIPVADVAVAEECLGDVVIRCPNGSVFTRLIQPMTGIPDVCPCSAVKRYPQDQLVGGNAGLLKQFDGSVGRDMLRIRRIGIKRRMVA